MRIWDELKLQLEKPRGERPLGSGWLSGGGSLLAGIVSILLVVVLRYPDYFVTPELSIVYESGFAKPFLHVVLLVGYALALISLLLNKEKLLGAAGLSTVMIAALLGGSRTEAIATESTSLYFGLDFFVVNVLFVGFLFIPLERFFPRYREQTVFRPEWQEDMFYYMVSSLLVQVLTFLTMAPSNYVNLYFDLIAIRSYIVALPFVVQVMVIMVVTDFVQYWLHRAFHQFPFLWRFHAIHHSATTMDWLAGARMHFVEIALLRGLTAVPMLTLGFLPSAVQTYVLIVYFYSSLVHANVGWNLGFIERFLVTPRYHHWHHGKEREAIDVNFAIHFPFYDRIFGTHHLPESRWPDEYGIADDSVPKGYWRQFLYPFSRSKPANHSPNSATNNTNLHE